MAVPKPPCDGCLSCETSMFSWPCTDCHHPDYRHFRHDVPAPAGGKEGTVKEYGFSQEHYRGFDITSEHEGEDGEVTGYTASVGTEEASEAVGEEVGSMMGGFGTVEAARGFVDSELGD